MRLHPAAPGPPPSLLPAFLRRENEQLRGELAATERLQLNGSIGSGYQAAAAEADLASARHQLAAAQQQAAEAEAAAERARGDAAAAQAAARKLESDLEDLSAAYGTLDAHTGSLQSQVERLQAELAEAQAAAQQQQHAGSSSGGGGGGISEAEVRQRVEAAAAEAAEAAAAEGDDAMGDLLVCLGQEEAKVRGSAGARSWGGREGSWLHLMPCLERRLPRMLRPSAQAGDAFLTFRGCCCSQVARLREQLEAMGVDCDALLADIVAAGEDTT